MSSKRKGGVEEDPEVIQARKFRAKCQFKALCRLVIANLHWLTEKIKYTDKDEVQKRIRELFTKKDELTFEDKVLLNKPVRERTSDDKKIIFKKIGDVKLFKQYPPSVRVQLAGVSYFKYFPSCRIILKEGHSPEAMYYIVSGYCKVNKLEYDSFLGEFVQVDGTELHAGDSFGETELLHELPRNTSIMTASHCQLITVLKEDFKYVISNTMEAKWIIIEGYMKMFSYFHDYDEVSLKQGCLIANIINFKRNDIVYGASDKDSQTHVHFLISGHCQIIEPLDIYVTTILGKELYTLAPQQYESASSEEAMENMDLDKMLLAASRNSKVLSRQKLSAQRSSSTQLGDSNSSTTLGRRSTIYKLSKTSRSGSLNRSKVSIKQKTVTSSYKGRPVTIFMQVGKLNPGATFGFGENMRARRICAMTDGVLMLLPQVWLLQRNTANIWNRVRHFLEKAYPTTKELFEQFVQERQWELYREEVVNEVVARSNAVNYTTIHDVPYYIRTNEVLKFCYGDSNFD